MRVDETHFVSVFKLLPNLRKIRTLYLDFKISTKAPPVTSGHKRKEPRNTFPSIWSRTTEKLLFGLLFLEAYS